MKTRRWCVYQIVIGVALGCIFFVGGREMLPHEVLDVYEMFHNVTGVLFSVFGLWVGVIYPKALQELLSPQKTHRATVDEIRSIIAPLCSSLFLFFVVFVVRSVAPFLEKSWPPYILSFILKVLLIILFMILVSAFGAAIDQLIRFQFGINKKATENEMNENLFLGKRLDKPPFAEDE